MPKCSVKKCKNNTLTTRKKDGVSYFRFPKNELEREKWRKIVAAEREEEFFKPNDSSVICSDHFYESDIYFTKTGIRKLNKQILPHIEIDQSTSSPGNAVLLITDIESSVSSLNFEKTAGEYENTQPSANNASDKNIRKTPSLTSSGLTSILDTPKTSFYKKSLKICQKTLEFKNKQIQNLKKKNKRLIKKNLSLKEIVTNLKKNRFVDESLSSSLTTTLNESNSKVIDILTAKKEVPFAKYPPDLRKFALTMQFDSLAAYKYMRDVFVKSLPHPNTLFRWYKIGPLRTK